MHRPLETRVRGSAQGVGQVLVAKEEAIVAALAAVDAGQRNLRGTRRAGSYALESLSAECTLPPISTRTKPARLTDCDNVTRITEQGQEAGAAVERRRHRQQFRPRRSRRAEIAVAGDFRLGGKVCAGPNAGGEATP